MFLYMRYKSMVIFQQLFKILKLYSTTTTRTIVIYVTVYILFVLRQNIIIIYKLDTLHLKYIR